MEARVSRLVLVIAALGCEGMAAPTRIANYPIDLSGTGLTFHWPKERLPVRYFVAADAGPVSRLVTEGITVWERQMLYGEYRGTLSTDSASADVVITVEGGVPPDLPVTDAPPVPVCEGRTRVDTRADRIDGPLPVRLRWDAGADPADVVNCLARIVAHEIGHTLGLFGHSADPEDLMNTNPRVQVPSTNDRHALHILYHTPSNLAPPERPSQ